MTIKFLGIYSKSREAGGCPACRAKRGNSGAGAGSYQRNHRITYPNGQTQSFTAHRPVVVSDYQAEYLLGLTYEHNGVERQMFVEVS